MEGNSSPADAVTTEVGAAAGIGVVVVGVAVPACTIVAAANITTVAGAEKCAVAVEDAEAGFVVVMKDSLHKGT